MLLFKKLSLVAVAVAASLPMLAVPTLRITDCGADGCGVGADITTLIADQSGIDNSASLGAISFDGTVGLWTLNLTSGTSKPISGSSFRPEMVVSSTNGYSGAGAGELMVEFSDDFFSGAPRTLNLATSSSGTPFSVFSGATFDTTNALFGGLLTDPAAIDYNGTAYTGVFSTPRTALNSFAAGGNYSLTSVVRLVASGAGTGAFTANLQAVPEPGFYGALALGLSGLFAAVARRRRAAKE